MSRNREAVVEYESESDGSEYYSETEPETEPEPEPTQIRPLKPSIAIPQQQPSSSDGDEENDSGSETDSDGADYCVKPLALKTNAPAPAPAPVPAPVAVTPAPKSAAPKRPAEDTTASADPKKKIKRTAEAETTSEKKLTPFERLWTDDDEIVVLKGMIDYSSQKESDPMMDLNAFHGFIKKNLHTDFTRAQLQDKIRRLKKKFVNNKSKAMDGKEMTFKPHEQKVYDLSKQIWVNENGSSVRKTASKKVKVNAGEREEVKEAKIAMGGAIKLNSSMEDRMLLAGRDLEGEDEWEELRREELELFLKQLKLKVTQTELVLEQMKAGR